MADSALKALCGLYLPAPKCERLSLHDQAERCRLRCRAGSKEQGTDSEPTSKIKLFGRHWTHAHHRRHAFLLASTLVGHHHWRTQPDRFLPDRDNWRCVIGTLRIRPQFDSLGRGCRGVDAVFFYSFSTLKESALPHDSSGIRHFLRFNRVERRPTDPRAEKSDLTRRPPVANRLQAALYREVVILIEQDCAQRFGRGSRPVSARATGARWPCHNGPRNLCLFHLARHVRRYVHHFMADTLRALWTTGCE